MPELKLNSPLQFIKGVGPRKAEALKKAGLVTVRDMLYYFPRAYLDRTNIVRIADLRVNEPSTIVGEIKAHGILHGRQKRYEAIIQDNSGALTILWFGGVRYFERLLKKGQVYAVSGVVTFYNGMQMVHPEMERLEDDSSEMVHAGRIIPVYPQTSELTKAGLNSRQLRALTTSLFENLREKLPEPFPDKIVHRRRLIPLHDAVRMLHYPKTRDEVERGRRRLAHDELLALQFFVYRGKGIKDKTIKKHSYEKEGAKLSSFREHLPFELTADQEECVREICDDLKRGQPMSRMIHGEVGSGKTVVAIVAGVYAAENSLQTAFMAPTEILAEQHHRNWREPLEKIGVRSELLTSSLKAVQKRKVAAGAASGEIDILFGTHTLIYDYVEFHRLGLVIIDEQHRFGVAQRGRLYAKGSDPDLLVMTATPIPRTLALTLYGDLDISTIRTLPPGRQPVRTVWRGMDKSDKVYQYVRQEIARGEQAYVIFPLIERSELLELRNIEEAYKELSAGLLSGVRLGLVHGRLKNMERDKVLRGFRDGDIDVLLSTTVLEVGIDNPNATLLVIENAERFGLAQLHQLRGRVGRGSGKSTVVALARQPISEMARRRLDFFVENSDGFAIAEADLELRGPGELFGFRQSGIPELNAADFGRDRDLLESTRSYVQKLFSSEARLDSADRTVYTFLEGRAKERSQELGGG